MSLYMPREDSFLLQIEVKAYAKGRVLDIGTGTGIQAITAAGNRQVKSILAVDISKKAVGHCKKEIKNRKITCRASDLFSNAGGEFDTIIFNPPYLPQDKYAKDAALIGGKKGHETIERFLDTAATHLSENGIILLLFSSLTGKEKIDNIIESNAFEHEKLQEKGVGLMERLYVYLIRKSVLLKKLGKNGIKRIRRFAKGHRGVIYIASYKGKRIAMKTQRADVQVNSIGNETSCLKKLQKHKIGPKLLFAGDSFFAYEFVEGRFIEDFVEKEKSTAAIKKVLQDIMGQCRQLDKLGMNKEEMHHPYKHIIVTKKSKPVLIDFERCRYSKDPKNVSQFCQYLITGKMGMLLKKKGIKLDKKMVIELAKEYKKHFDSKSFNKLSALLK